MDKNIIAYVACICLLFIMGRIFIVPLGKVIKIILNSVMGAGIIYLINLIGANWNFSIGINIITSIIVGLLGIPGVILIIFVKLLISS